MDSTQTFWSQPLTVIFQALKSSEDGLTNDEAGLRSIGNTDKPPTTRFAKDVKILLSQFKSPLVLILIGAIILASFLGDYTNSIIVLAIIMMSSVVGFWQERNAGRAIEKLQQLVQVTATVMRNKVVVELALNKVVPGDIVFINAGDIIPGDGRLISCDDLHINEAALTGESFPREKSLEEVAATATIAARTNSVFKGTSVISGSGTVIVVSTGRKTIFGQVAAAMQGTTPLTAFERGTKQFGYYLLQLTLVFSLVILLLNLYLGKPVIDSALFALALAIGITPELLPAITIISLSAGARRMAERKVIVKKLTAIHNLGAVDTFCIDKTGTLTEGVVKVHNAIDLNGNENEKVMRFAVWNAACETGFTNPIDEALRLKSIDFVTPIKVDEVPYDFIRKRLSVVIKTEGRDIIITKGAVKNILEVCTRVEYNDKIEPIELFRDQIEQTYDKFGSEGYRTIAVSYKDITGDPVISKEDEHDLTFLGFILLNDPPKPFVAESLKQLNDSGIHIKVITGDNVRVAAHLGSVIGLQSNNCLTGSQLRIMTDEALAYNLQYTTIFAETEPDQKERIVRVLQKSGHTVGFIGDGINDVSALHTADVGISVDSAADIARETADIVLLEKDLDVLHDGVMEGRKTFVNSLKYIFITTSANFGNMFSVAGASLWLTFLPLLPKQILLINFLTDLPAMALASDAVDQNNLHTPQKWNNKLIRNFMIVFGLQSAVFDFITFFVLFHFFKANTIQFRTGWYFECILSELVLLLIIRTRGPFYKSHSSKYLIYISIVVALITFLFTYSPFNKWFGFTPLPAIMLFSILFLVLFYAATAELTKKMFYRSMQNH